MVEDSSHKLLLYLKKAQIRNYAPLIDTCAEFQQGLNIIIGPNGVGKTRFLSITSQLVTPFITPDVGIGCELVLGYDEDVTVHFQQSSPAESEKIGLVAHNSTLSSDDELEVSINYKGENVVSDDLDMALAQVGIDFFASPEPVFAKHGNPLQQLALVDVPATLTIRTTNGRSQLEPRSEATAYASRPQLIGALFSAIGSSFSWHYRYQRINKIEYGISIEEIQAEVKRITEAYFDFINPFIRQYSPISEIRLSGTFQVYDNATQQEILVKGLVLEYLLGENWLPFSALSDGTKRILYLITQMIMPNIHLDGRLAPPAPFSLEVPPRIIFLEEPELGIHHSQLHKLLQLIRKVSRDNQVILTTHAPQVLDMLAADELDRITVCSLDPKKGTQFHKLSEEKQEQARVYMQEVGFLSDYWRYSYLEEAEAE